MVVAGRCRSLVVRSEGLILTLLLDSEILELVSSIYLRTPKAMALNKWHSTWGQRGQTRLPKRRWYRKTSHYSVEAILGQPDPGHSGKLFISSSLDALCLALPRKLPGTLASQSWSVQTETMTYVVSFSREPVPTSAFIISGNNTKADTCTSLSQICAVETRESFWHFLFLPPFLNDFYHFYLQASSESPGSPLVRAPVSIYTF